MGVKKKQGSSLRTEVTYLGNTFSLSRVKMGEVIGWEVEDFYLREEVILPAEHDGIPVISFHPLVYEATYPRVKRLFLGRYLREVSLHDAAFPDLEEICLGGNAFLRAEGTNLYSAEGELLSCLRDRSCLPKGEGMECLAEDTKTVMVRRDTLMAVLAPVDTLVLGEKVKKIAKGAFLLHAPRRIESFHLLEKEYGGTMYELPGAKQVKELVIKNPEEHLVRESLLFWQCVERVHLPNGCEGYTSRDGIIYGEEGRSLFFCPPRYPAKDGCFTIPEGVEKIEERAFWYSRLTRVQMPDSVRVLGKEAFLMSRELEEVYLSDEIEEIPSSGIHARYVYTAGAFGGCLSLRFVHLPRKLKILGANAFLETDLSQVQIPEGVEEIGLRAFYETNIESIFLPASVKRVGKDAFFGKVRLIEATEGTAKGLFLAASASKNHKVRIRVTFSDRHKECLPLPINYRWSLSELLSQAWDGEEVDWEAYAKCIPSMKEEDLRMKMSFLVALHLSKKDGSPYRKYLSGRAGRLGEMLIKEGEEEVFAEYLKLLKPSRKVCDQLLILCNEKKKAAFIPYLLSLSKGKEVGSDLDL